MADHMVSDGVLVSEALEGNLTSFEKLVKRYEKQLLGFAYKKVLDEDTAKDVVQETFIRVFKNLSTFDRSKSFSPWAYTIAKNLSLDVIRKGKHTAALEWEVEDSKDSLITKLIRAEVVSDVWKAIRSLPEKYKVPLWGYYFADLSYRDLSYALQISENTIKTRIRRAKGYLRIELRRKGYG